MSYILSHTRHLRPQRYVIRWLGDHILEFRDIRYRVPQIECYNFHTGERIAVNIIRRRVRRRTPYFFAHSIISRKLFYHCVYCRKIIRNHLGMCYDMIECDRRVIRRDQRAQLREQAL